MTTPPGPHAMTAQAGAVVPFGYISERSADFLLREGGTSIGTNIEREWDPHHCVPLYTTPPSAMPGAGALEGLVAKMTQHVDHDGCACCHTKSWRDELTQLIKERSNG